MSDDWDFSRPLAPGPANRPASGNGDQWAGDRTWPAEPRQDAARGEAGGNFFGPTEPGAVSATTAASPPFVWLVLAAFAALLGVVVAAVSLDGGAVYIAAWAIGGPVAIGLLALFVRKDTARQSLALYSYPSWKALAYRGVLVLCLLAVVATALRIADWAGRR